MAPPSKLRQVTLADSAEVIEYEEPQEQKPGFMKREATLYDVVAGRYTHRGLSIRGHEGPFGSRKLKPEEALFAKAAAPPLYAEDPYAYDAAALLPSDDPKSTLPSSDLCKSLHTYASDLYSRHPRLKERKKKKGGDVWDGDMAKSFWELKKGFKNKIEYKSMDETALLSLGILMEEMQREALGQTGDLVFTEEGEERAKFKKRKRRDRNSQEEVAGGVQEMIDLVDGEDDLQARKRRRKEERRARKEAKRASQAIH